MAAVVEKAAADGRASPNGGTLTLLWHPDHTPTVYPDTFDLYRDLAAIVRQEVEALATLGCDYVQIDAA